MSTRKIPDRPRLVKDVQGGGGVSVETAKSMANTAREASEHVNHGFNAAVNETKKAIDSVVRSAENTYNEAIRKITGAIPRPTIRP